MSVEEVFFTCIRDGLTIRGMQYLPMNHNENMKYPVIITSHGFTGNYTDMEDYCKEFARMGYVAFSFGFCGGGSPLDQEDVKSEGKSTDMTISTEIEDLCTIIDYVKSKPYIDQENLILLGVSQGGLVSGLAAAKCGDEIKKVIMICPALCIPDHARRGYLGGADYDPYHVPDRIDCGRTVLGKGFHEDVVGMEPFLELSQYQGPVLILQGLEDTTVNYSYAVRAKESYKEGQCHLQLIRNQGHGFDEKQRESVIASIRQFLNQREEILTIRVIITHVETFIEGETQKNNIYFTGYCETKYFQGAILPGACDRQEYHANMENKIRAEYTLTGLDSRGDTCSIHIINQKFGEEWKPIIETNSTVLQWMNHADLTAVLEYGSGGPTVRIFADMV